MTSTSKPLKQPGTPSSRTLGSDADRLTSAEKEAVLAEAARNIRLNRLQSPQREAQTPEEEALRRLD